MDVELACPGCRKTIMIALSRMSAGNTLECTTCGAVIPFAAASDLIAAQRAVDELKKLADSTIGFEAPDDPRGERPWWKFWGA